MSAATVDTAAEAAAPPVSAAQLLEQHFDAAFAAPDGLKKLRELILTLAMQGKLVEQDPGEGTAQELLTQIEAEKRRLVAAGKLKAPKPLPPIEADEVPYAVPEGWAWVRLGEVTQIIRGITFPGSEKGREPGEGKIACLRTANVQKEIDWDDLIYVDRKYVSREDQIVCENDIVMSMANSRELVGKVALAENLPTEAAFGGFLGVIRSFLITPQYLMSLLTNQYTREALIDAASQTTNIANISLGKLNPHLIPLPPLPEQRRIVARIAQLMARCDELEALRAAQQGQRLDLHAAALSRLLGATDAPAFAGAWQFVAQHFGELHSAPHAVAELRKAVLQLAVMGKLVPQDPSEGTARELLAQIAQEKRRLVAAKKIKAPKPLPPVEPKDRPYEVPEGWEWVRFSDVTTEIATGPFGSMIHQADYVEDGVPLINPSHMKNGQIVPDHSISVSGSKLEELESHLLFEGDIVMARRGELGRCAIVDSDSKGFLCGTGSFVVRFSQDVDRTYVTNLFKTDPV